MVEGCTNDMLIYFNDQWAEREELAGGAKVSVVVGKESWQRSYAS